MKRVLIYSLLGMSIILIFGVAFASAHPGKPDNIWTDPLPEFCPDIWDPVHDGKGDVYSSVMCAAKEGVRVTWNGEA